MARFYGEMQGSRGATSRMGTAYSGFHAWVRGWHVGAAVDMYPEDDGDRAVVYASTGSAGIERAECIGSLRNVDGELVLTPTAWTIAQVKAHEKAAKRELRRIAREAAKHANPRTVETDYGTVTIHENTVCVSAEDGQLYAWANRPGNSWPCSTLRDFDKLAAWFDSNGLCELQGFDSDAPDVYDTEGIDGNELSAYCADVLTAANLPTDHPAYVVAVGQFQAS